MNARRAGSRSPRSRFPRRRTRRWALISGLTAGALALIGVFVLLIQLAGEGEDEAAQEVEETAEESPARCERHGIARPDPRANPERVSGAGGQALDGGYAVQLAQEFTSDDTTGHYHLFTRDVDFDEPVGLVVRLHGDGTNEQDNPDGLLNCLAAVAASHNMIMVAPRSPDEEGEVTWWEDISTNLPWLLDLVDDRVIQPYGVDPERVWWMGYSGGAELITYGVLPRNPEAVTGGALMVGGGGAPRRLLAEPTSEQQEDLELLWVTGTLDDGTDPVAPFDALEAAAEGSAWYRDQGFEQVSTEYPVGDDHFSVPQARLLDEALQESSRVP